MPILYTSQLFGTTPTVSVSTFGNLPASPTTNQRVSITGESNLFNTTTYPAIVRWSGSAWQLESCAATYLNIGAVEFASGTWTGTGGTVGTKNGATIIDTTYNDSWIWNSTNSVFLPTRIATKTINNIKSIKGDSTSPSGWVLNSGVGTGGSPNGTVTVSTSPISVGGPTALQATTTSTSPQLSGTYIQYAFTDTGISTTTNFYVKTLLVHSLSRDGSGQASVRLQYENGSSAVDFGAVNSSGGMGGKDGIYYNAASLSTYTTAAGGTNTEDVMTTATLVQFYVEGARSFVKIGTNPWKNVTVASGLQRDSSVKGFSIVTVTQPSSGTAFNATSKIAYLKALRYS